MSIIDYVQISVNVAEASGDKFGFGNLMGVFDHDITEDRQNGPYLSLAEVVAAGFTEAAAEPVYYWASSVFAQAKGVDKVLIGRISGSDANYAAALTAIDAEADQDWYVTNIESRVSADIESAAGWVESAGDKIFIPQTQDADVLTGGAGNVAEDLAALNYNRTALLWHSGSGTDNTNAFADGAWSSVGGGMNLDIPGGVGIWMYKTLTGVVTDKLNSTQRGNIKDDNASFYATTNGSDFTSFGTMASGRKIDIMTSMDWLEKRLQEAVLSLFVSTSNSGKKIPYTNAGINQVVGAVQGVLDKGVSFGHLSPDVPPTINVPNVVTISAEDKENRVLTLTGQAKFSGAIEKFNFSIDVSF